MEIILTFAYRFVLASLFLFSSYFFGYLIIGELKYKKYNFHRLIIHLLYSSFGFGVLGYLVLFLGQFGFINFKILFTIIFISGLSGIYLALQENISIDLRFSGFFIFYNKLNYFNRLILVFLILLIILNFLGSFAPPLIIDDIKYHFMLPNEYIRTGYVSFIDHFPRSNLPILTEMLWTLLIAICGAELCHFINVFFGIWCILWIWAICSYLELSISSKFLAFMFFYSISVVTTISQSGMVELNSTVFFLAAVFILLLRNNIKLDYKMKIVLGIFFGFYISTKIIFLPIVFGIILILFIKNIYSNNEKTTKYIIFENIIISGGIFIPISIWFLKSYLYTGNPIYPFFNSIILGYNPQNLIPGVDISTHDNTWHQLEKFPMSLFYFFTDLITTPKNSRGYFSPMILCIIPYAFFYFKTFNKNLKILIYICIPYLITCILLYGFVRIMLPMLVILSIICSFVLAKEFNKNNYFKYFVQFLLFIWMLQSLSYALNITKPKFDFTFGFNSYGDYIIEKGKHPRYKFYNYSALNFINENLPKSSKILLWSNDGYYLKREFIYAFNFMRDMADPSKLYDETTCFEELKKHGITHVAMTDDGARRKLTEIIESKDNLKIIYDDGLMKICILP
jgi:hypothetical protein